TNDLINKNKPDNYYQYCTGGKTGSASSAGYCLVSTAQKGDISLLAVVMDSGTDANNTPQHFADTKTLYDWGFGNFSYREVLSSTENVDRTVPVTMGSGADSVALRPENSISILLANDDDLSTFQRDFSNIPASLEAPVEVGTYLGDISISRNGTVYGTSRLLAATSVSQDRIANLKQQIDKTWKLPQVQTVFWILVALFALYLIYLVIYYIRRFRYRRSVRQARRLRKQQLAQQPRGLPENYGGGDGGYSVTGARRATGQFEPQASQRIPQMAQGEAWRGSTSTGIQQSQRTPILQDTRNRRAEGSEIQPPESKDSEERQGFFEDFFNNQ
ncbi:MAG: hypothetical protein FWC62_02790, partial [Firmicutes bacterium]|nr:hypothetical protein [Bacillota bacterium]